MIAIWVLVLIKKDIYLIVHKGFDKLLQELLHMLVCNPLERLREKALSVFTNLWISGSNQREEERRRGPSKNLSLHTPLPTLSLFIVQLHLDMWPNAHSIYY